MNMFDNYPQPSDYTPNNRPRHHERPVITIMTGESATHSFDVPFDLTREHINVEVMYKLGLDIVVTKTLNELDVVDNDDHDEYSNVTVHLSSDETALFHNTLLDAFVQMRFTLVDGDIMYSEIYPVIVEDSLDGGSN